MNGQLIPALDPTPLPAPAAVFHILLVLTFFIHAILVNLTLGGTLIAAFSQILSGGKAGDHRTELAQRLMGINTYAISMAITTGVAPLLFVQVLYHRFFYSATILLGTFWFGLLVALLLGYYAAYAYKFRGAPRRGSGGTAWLVVSAIAFLLIAMVHVAVHLLHAQPELWTEIAAHPLSILQDRSYFVRLLHFVFAALGFAALVAAWDASRRAARDGDAELERKIIGLGWRWATITTLAQVLDGFFLLAVLPRPVLQGLMGGGWQVLLPLGASVFFALGLLMMLSTTANPYDRPARIRAVLLLMTLAIAVMSITRHQVRDLYLAPYLEGAGAATVSQWGNFVLFGLLFVAGLATVAYMVQLVRNHPATADDAA